MQPRSDHLAGPARLRWRVRQALQDSGTPYRDQTTATELHRQPVIPSRNSSKAFGLTATLRQAAFRGLLAGWPEADRTDLVQDLVHSLRQRLLLLACDSAAAHRWQQAMAARQLHDLVTVFTVRDAAQRMHWLGCHHELLVVDAPEMMPRLLLDEATEQSAALARIALLGRADGRDVMHWSKGIGPLLSSIQTEQQQHYQQIQVPMPRIAEQSYAQAWSVFLAAFDRFVAARGTAAFGTFIAQARKDPQQRPAVFAWHDAVRCAAWHEHKAAVVSELLERHNNERVLVFTPNRRVAYDLAREHLIGAITSEIPRGERNALLTGFANGSMRVLAGPRLLDAGVAEASADVAILVGGGFGIDQRTSRRRRVRPMGTVYEIVSQHTLEVGKHPHRPVGEAGE